jgi:hypothetical protein
MSRPAAVGRIPGSTAKIRVRYGQSAGRSTPARPKTSAGTERWNGLIASNARMATVGMTRSYR